MQWISGASWDREILTGNTSEGPGIHKIKSFRDEVGGKNPEGVMSQSLQVWAVTPALGRGVGNVTRRNMWRFKAYGAHREDSLMNKAVRKSLKISLEFLHSAKATKNLEV